MTHNKSSVLNICFLLFLNGFVWSCLYAHSIPHFTQTTLQITHAPKMPTNMSSPFHNTPESECCTPIAPDSMNITMVMGMM